MKKEMFIKEVKKLWDSKVIKFFRERIDIITIFTLISIVLKEVFFLHTLREPDVASVNLLNYMFFPFESLFVTPDSISTILMVVMLISFCFLFKGKYRYISCYIVNLFVSMGILFELWYYRANHNFLSVRHLVFPETFNPLGNSLFQLEYIDIFLFVDLVILTIIFFKTHKTKKIITKRSIALALSFFIGSGIYLNYRAVKINNGEIPGELFRNSWVPFQTMMNTSFLGYNGFDIYKYLNYSQTQELTIEEKQEVDSWLKSNKEKLPDNKYKGMLEGKNLIFIQVESFENFTMNKKINGEEITPNMNKLLENSLYFNNIMEQNNTGFSSDCDLMVNTGLLPKTTDSVAFSRPQLDVYSLAEMLKDKGYNTISSRTEEGGNWNWAECHKGIYDFDTLIDLNKLDKDDMRGINLSDKSYFRQMAEKTKEFKEPYYSMMVTINTHAPFGSVKEEEKHLNFSAELNENYMGKYLQSLKYVDEQIGIFMDELNKSGELDNTVIAIYGDHTGIHKSYEEEIQSAPIEGEWWKKQDYRIPLIIYNKDIKGEVIETHGGQVDFYPTIAYLMGVDRDEVPDSSLGRILLNTERDSMVLKNGTVMGNPKSEEEKEHLRDAVRISELMIKSNYFPRKIKID